MALDPILEVDVDQRETSIRQRAYDESEFWANGPHNEDWLVATYFLKSRADSLTSAGKSISYHMTTGVKKAAPGSRIERCSGKVVGVKPWDATERIGLLRVAFPVELFERPDGKYHSTDFLHLMAGEGVFGLWEFAEARLIHVQIPSRVMDTFPGPAYGPGGLRALTCWGDEEPAFGTILKPTAGITDGEVAELVGGVAGEPLFMFIKEDENLFPSLPYCPVESRSRKSVEVIRQLQDTRGGRGLIFAPHITSPPGELHDTLMRVLETGVNGIMFSEQFTGGSVRAVRDWTASLPAPPVIYGHNSGISTRTNTVWREVLDYFARLDGVDFRQTALLTPALPLLRPQGLEWRKCEEALSRPAGRIKPTMIARAGGLDQGNIIPNLEDAAQNLPKGQVLYLAGSAINSVNGADGKPDSQLGARAMREALELWRARQGPDTMQDLKSFVRQLYDLAKTRRLRALTSALEQRYSLS